MPRPPRALAAGIYHLAAHGSDTRHLFLDDGDRRDFLTRLAAACERFELALVSYVLLGNHYHALVRIPDERLSRALQHLHTAYSREHNRRRGRSAHLFRAHPLIREIETAEQLVATARYFAKNPVEAGLADGPLLWRWSSARAHAGLERASIPLDENDLRHAYGDDPGWRTRYRDDLGHPPKERPRQAGPFESSGGGI